MPTDWTDWVPLVFVAFKALVLGAGMYYAIKWHYDQEDRGERAAVLRAGGKIAAIFVVSLLALGTFAFTLGGMLGLDLSMP